MTPVRDDDGNQYLLRKRGATSSLVYDPETDTERYVENDHLEALEESGLEFAASAVSEPVRTLLVAVPDEQTLGLLFELVATGPLSVRAILERSTFCESDLHGRLTVLRTAGVLEETTVHGERGYRVRERYGRTLEALRDVSVDNQ